MPGGALADEEPQPLTTVAAIRQLSVEEARQGLPVKIRGVVTLSVAEARMLIVQDETGGIYVSPFRLSPEQRRLPPGTKVEVEGITGFGDFSPQITNRPDAPVRVTELGEGELPKPVQLSLDQLADPQHQNQWIETSGVVHSVTRESIYSERFEGVIIALASPSERVSAVVFRRTADELPTDLVGATVRVCGVFSAVFNNRGQLMGMRLVAPSIADFRIEQPAPGNAFDLPVRPIASLMQFDVHRPISERVRVEGTVTQVIPERGMYVQNGESSIWVKTIGEPRVERGDRVEAAGFPALGDWNPILEDAVFRKIGPGELPPAKPISLRQALSGDYDGRLVSMEGALLEATTNLEEPTLVLQAGERLLFARLLGTIDQANLSAIRIGSTLRLSGICVNARSSEAPEHTAPHVFRSASPSSVQLLVNLPDGLAVLHQPSWWTVPRIAAALGLASLVAAAALAWVWALRRQVALQTEVIRRQLARENVYEERARIARELHDTLEQELAGISLQLDTASDRLNTSTAEAGALLDMARSLLRHSRGEARRAILDLRASLLEGGHLASALETIAAQASNGQGVEVALRVEGEPVRLPGRIEATLLRIGQEALSNALRHAAPRRVDLDLRFAPREVTLSVRDDGRGFDPSDQPAGHFGLLGMRERAERVRGRLSITSAPGRGTAVSVSVPVDSTAEENA